MKMAIIQKKTHFEGSIGTEEAFALFDAGSTYSCIRPEIAKKLGMIEKLPRPMVLGTAKKKGKK
jgi:hypothetical protein